MALRRAAQLQSLGIPAATAALNLGGALAATQRSPRGCHFSHRPGGVALERSPRLAIQSRKLLNKDFVQYLRGCLQA
jgi:hypothetical protein